jgi:formylglycine-generating enzyme required for sulfatase activity
MNDALIPPGEFNFSHPMKYILVCFTGLLVIAAHLHAEGPLSPPGAPMPTMKTLQEIWDRIGELEAQNADLQAQLSELRTFIGAPFTMEMVTVGNAGNANDPEDGDSINPGVQNFGSVAYEYKIGKYEVTNDQYVQFLNAVAAADPNGLYDTNMSSNPRGGITRAGTSPNFTYAAKELMGDKPVGYVNWYDAQRFCNWLHNGRRGGAQGPGTTEDGAYTFTGPLAVGGRNAGARFHLPSENEWYKAAYHHPVEQGGDTDNYWLYPTRSNSAPTIATADGAGSIDNDTANIANYDRGADWNGQDGNATTVGSGGPGSASFYGAFDMGGNHIEWTEQLTATSFRVLRGGAWVGTPDLLESALWSGGFPASGNVDYGFRVASPQ